MPFQKRPSEGLPINCMIIKFCVWFQAVIITAKALTLLEPIRLNNGQMFDGEDLSKRSGYSNAKRMHDQLWKYLQRFNQNGHHSYRFGLIGKRSGQLFDDEDNHEKSYRYVHLTFFPLHPVCI